MTEMIKEIILEILPVMGGVAIGISIAVLIQSYNNIKLKTDIEKAIKSACENTKMNATLAKVKESLDNKQAQANLEIKIALAQNGIDLEEKKKLIDDKALKDIIDTCR